MFKLLDSKDDFVTQKQLDVMEMELSLMESMYIISAGDLRDTYTKRGLSKNPLDMKVYSEIDSKSNRHPTPLHINSIGLDNDFRTSGDYDVIISAGGAGYIFDNRDELSFNQSKTKPCRVVNDNGVSVYTVDDRLCAARRLMDILENFHSYSDLVTAERQYTYTTYYRITDISLGQTLASYIFLTSEEIINKRKEVNEAKQKVIFVEEDRINDNHKKYMRRIEKIKEDAIKRDAEKVISRLLK